MAGLPATVTTDDGIYLAGHEDKGPIHQIFSTDGAIDRWWIMTGKPGNWYVMYYCDGEVGSIYEYKSFGDANYHMSEEFHGHMI